MALKLGCASFAVAHARYFDTLPTIELAAAFIEPPSPQLARKWRAEAPAAFEFSLAASQLITHPSTSGGYAKLKVPLPPRRAGFVGHFRDSPEVALAWEATRAAASALAAKFVVFETPASFYPDADHLKSMYRFFKTAPRGSLGLVWHPRGSWEPKLIAKVSADLGLLRARDPFEEPCDPPPPGPRYFRLRGEAYSDAQLKQLRRWSEGAPSYAYFLRRNGWLVARRMAEGRA